MIPKLKGVRGAATGCALAACVYLLARGALYLLADGLLGLARAGATMASPVGISDLAVASLRFLIGALALAAPTALLLYATALGTDDLRVTLPAPWSPAFCLPVFLGVANAGNLLGALLERLSGAAESESVLLPSGGAELFVWFLAMCVMPAVMEELFFRGAMQGLMRPCGSAAAIFAPALLFGLLHLRLSQALTAFVCGVFLGWLAERSGSILPGMLCHLCNNCLAFLTMYLQLYAPAEAAAAVQLFILLFFPVFAVRLIWHARGQGFRFSAGLRPGVDVSAVFASPAYTICVIFLALYCVFR